MRILKFIVILLIILVVATTLTIRLSPQFGGRITSSDRESFQKLPNYNLDEEIFENQSETNMDMDLNSIWSLLKEFTREDSTQNPSKDVQVMQLTDLTEDSIPNLVWFGHSSFLIQANGVNILLDPMLSAVPSPFDFLGQPRFNSKMPMEVTDLPEIDFVIISHDHYDHLDYETVMELKSKTNHFLVPTGVGVHLKRWEIEEEKIHEMYWWEEKEMDGLKFVFAPARHFSGRRLFDRSETLWGSWVIQMDNLNVYFSGDGGYDDHFKEIGNKYGPFDFTMIECGQYNERWDQIHMMPEESVQACKDLNSKLSMPIHWGAFTLALHSWTDPIERFTKSANDMNLPFITPEIGERVMLGLDYPKGKWWENYK